MYIFSKDPDALRDWVSKYFPPLPAKVEGAPVSSPAIVDLGKKLFHDPILSSDGTVSCASCHKLDALHAGSDGETTSVGVGKQRGPRNAPTVVNAAFQKMFFWDGRAATLEEQAKEPLLNPVEMGNADESAVVKSVAGVESYREMFAGAYPDDPEPTFEKITACLAAFQRTLISPARFDDFLHGDNSALNDVERRGLEMFIISGCRTCHEGPLLGGQSFRKFGVIAPFAYKNKMDTGRMKLTGDKEDEFVFKVPQLRNVALTAPYFHDGGVRNLEEAINTMSRLQVGYDVSPKVTQELVAFLKTLTSHEFVESEQETGANNTGKGSNPDLE